MITIITLTMGREKYLHQLINSIYKSISENKIEHIIIYQGCSPSTSDLDLFHKVQQNSNYLIKSFYLKENIGIGLALNFAKQYIDINSKILLKLDDDCLIITDNFFNKILNLTNLLTIDNKNYVLSPFPVGLINNKGGPEKNNEHKVLYDNLNDIYYTLRPVSHIGGFARICPTELFKNFHFPDDRDRDGLISGSEDGHFSNFAKLLSIPMYYCENELIVEHNESTIGQHHRYGVKYFGKRF